MNHHSLSATTLLALSVVAAAAPGDPHYTPGGFFDIHVCNWPDRPPFYMALVSTARFREVESVTVRNPDGAPVGTLDLTRYREFQPPGKPLKRAFISQFPLPDPPRDGWFEADIRLAGGEVHQARDYVIHTLMDQVQDLKPAADSTGVPTTTALEWTPVPGAARYQVYIRDLWAGEETIHTSPLIETSRYQPPAGLFRPGGYYAWKVHARDIHEHSLLGDFNHGSQSHWVTFETRD